MGEAMKVLRGLHGVNVIGADIAYPMPIKDNPSQLMAMNVVVLMFEQIYLLADY